MTTVLYKYQIGMYLFDFESVYKMIGFCEVSLENICCESPLYK